ncbi:MAG: GntR family transcriptional regulator [Chloroflexota bacterium]|nr:GntR family transcriptional regulator [Chloroflexota bacterium]
MAPNTRPIARRVFREDVKEYLIGAILSGRLQPDERIIETRLAQELGISQGPVREALRDLDLFGFVVSEPFRGARVRRFSPEDLVGIYPVRAALEGLAARSAAERVDADFIQRLSGLFAHIRQMAAIGDRHAYMEADDAFHEAIVLHSGNSWLSRFWQNMNLPMTTIVTLTFSTRSLPDLAERHAPIFAALVAGDALAAEAAMRRHIEEIAGWVLAALAEQENPPLVGAGLRAAGGAEE